MLLIPTKHRLDQHKYALSVLVSSVDQPEQTSDKAKWFKLAKFNPLWRSKVTHSKEEEIELISLSLRHSFDNTPTDYHVRLLTITTPNTNAVQSLLRLPGIILGNNEGLLTALPKKGYTPIETRHAEVHESSTVSMVCNTLIALHPNANLMSLLDYDNSNHERSLLLNI